MWQTKICELKILGNLKIRVYPDKFVISKIKYVYDDNEELNKDFISINEDFKDLISEINESRISKICPVWVAKDKEGILGKSFVLDIAKNYSLCIYKKEADIIDFEILKNDDIYRAVSVCIYLTKDKGVAKSFTKMYKDIANSLMV
jgi:hypothetical protein